ncbi:hypothetical protein MTR_8g040480 [Medicago truncatula]|uniref:Uncharacterized protein n=1 Tax=Medicago truncatula TaxID=3880 RepID=G7LHK5_MEDTR|nr:hypothetical protein MTR_8g040480 [Medicago truncatula]
MRRIQETTTSAFQNASPPYFQNPTPAITKHRNRFTINQIQPYNPFFETATVKNPTRPEYHTKQIHYESLQHLLPDLIRGVDQINDPF